MPTIGIVLSGCGVFDGSEIHEAVACLHAADVRGAARRCLAPSGSLEVIDHATGSASGERREVLAESARIARGRVDDLASVHGGELDALVFPGGFGAAKNLCDFAARGAACAVHPDVERVIVQAYEAGRPLGFCCISPVIAARVLGPRCAPRLTIGTDPGTAAAIREMGAEHVDCATDGIVVDERNRIVTTPAYMHDAPIAEVFRGIDLLMDRIVEMT